MAYQASGNGDKFMMLPEDRLSITMRLRKLAIDTSFTSVVPLIIINEVNFYDYVAHVVLDCKLRQSGTSAPLWEGTGEGRVVTKQLVYENIVLKAVSIAVDQCITKSGLLETRTRLDNQRYARLMTYGAKQATDGNTVKALDAYGQAYNWALTSEQSLDAVKAMAQAIKVVQGNPDIPEESRKFKVYAEGAVRDKKFNDAAGFYEEALKIAPWWYVGHFNRALVLGETGDYTEAKREMNFYLQLVPDAPNAHAAQDKIYDWERLEGK